ncbi:hypothetical protein CJD36_021365 [Flavipsychrobacter stenotrophus]|uniref:Uncharacterized protein n=1 Tax=Flavipsychrobacter stenotrophus TaxID=2077091 RepID=A0A2S7SQQ6_9BACT|nr:hypothetical protein [Flavipsychrobacter stenotrophus]PQJ08961.1 hypothetical protein CJD36_021365 [Flavipsychrobacter stenotrophus]
MNQFEKVLFLELTCYQLIKVATEQEEYLKAYGLLSEEEKKNHALLHQQIHNAWSYINSPFLNGVNRPLADSIFEYNERVAAIDDRILQLCKDFDITLSETATPTSEKFKGAIREYLGL